MKNNRSSYLSTRRDAWVEINIGKVENNIYDIDIVNDYLYTFTNTVLN